MRFLRQTHRRIVALSKIARRKARAPFRILYDRGYRGETYACIWLHYHGFLVWERNWRIKTGEIDIVASAGRCLYFFEVKTRSAASAAFLRPAAAVNEEKLNRLERLSTAYRRRHLANLKRTRIKEFQIVTIEIIERRWRPPITSALFDLVNATHTSGRIQNNNQVSYSCRTGVT